MASWGTTTCLSVAMLACAPLATAGPGCAEVGSPIVISRALGETSGIAIGRVDPDVLWTHNDGNSDLYTLDRAGAVTGRIAVSPRLRDWEDIEISACASGSCLYFSDTGDNRERRPAGQSGIFRVAEPRSNQESVDPDAFPIRFPDGPRDVEALYVLPGEVPHLVTKGASHAITVYRYPPPLRPDTVTLVEVQRLSDGPVGLLDRVTGASASPDGRTVGVRTYQSLRFYRVEGDTLVAVDGGVVNLRTLQEIQGEGVGIGPDGLVALTSEGGPLGGPPSLRLMRCRLGG